MLADGVRDRVPLHAGQRAGDDLPRVDRESRAGARSLPHRPGSLQCVALRNRETFEPIEHRCQDLVQPGERQLHLRLDAHGPRLLAAARAMRDARWRSYLKALMRLRSRVGGRLLDGGGVEPPPLLRRFMLTATLDEQAPTLVMTTV